MEKIKKSELKKLSSRGTAKDITNAEYKSDFSKLEKIAYCSGTYGMTFKGSRKRGIVHNNRAQLFII